jgi:peroxiredoxin
VLSVIDGERPLAQAATQAVLPWDEFVRAVLRLESLGLLEARPAGVSKKHLVPGDPAPNFTLRALDGSAYSLGSRRGGKTLLAFFRHAGCPFCNFRLHQLIQAYPDLQAVGVEVVGVFGSPLETLRERAGRQRPNFPVLADPDDTVHNLYGTGNSLLGLLDPRGLGAYLRGLALGIPHGSVDGELLRMPAEFLIDEDLKVVRAHYGAHGGDRLSLQEVLAWGQAS